MFKFQWFCIVTCSLRIASQQQTSLKNSSFFLTSTRWFFHVHYLAVRLFKESNFMRTCGKLLWEVIQVINNLTKREKKNIFIYLVSQFPDPTQPHWQLFWCNWGARAGASPGVLHLPSSEGKVPQSMLLSKTSACSEGVGETFNCSLEAYFFPWSGLGVIVM